MSSLVLSLFPGIGLFDKAFECEGFTVVRGPDVLWGGDVRGFHPPIDVFDGVIGGPPCQAFTRLAIMVHQNGYEPKFGNLIPEFERCVAEARPRWFLMENVPAAPEPVVDGYIARHQVINNRWFTTADETGAEQNRKRRISFGTYDGRNLPFDVALFEHPGDAQAVLTATTPVPIKIGGSGKVKKTFAVTARHAGRLTWMDEPGSYTYTLEDACELQGLPRNFTEHMPFTKQGKLKAVANGVPLPMGRALARAVKRAVW